MDKQVTGQINDKKKVRDDLRDARARFKIYTKHLHGKKNEYPDIKEENNKEREAIRRAERIAEQFKFTNMSKKADFLPQISVCRNFNEYNSVHAIGTEFIEYGERLKLTCPDKSITKGGPLWKI